jgi:hypothetical protein
MSKDEQTEEILKTVRSIDERLRDMEMAVLGHEGANIEGYGTRIGRMESDISTLKQKDIWGKGVAWAIAGLMAIVVTVLPFLKDKV